ncbi:MAG: OB-fold nucleic acid binding domain-containing protein [Candidatus Bathyarchaeota archaeon]|nr:OB-fold nucleic acid binding domain-containing protein [Candidatus Bathyarchaeota archaeon]
MTLDDIIALILQQRPELTEEQIRNRLSVARDMTGGLIADESLGRMIAAELTVDIPQENGTFKPKLSIGHMVEGLYNATVTGRVVAVYPVKTFDGARSGKLASVVIVDNDGVLRVVLWGEKTDLVESGDLQVGTIAKFAHGYTKADRYTNVELHMGDRSRVDTNLEHINQDDYPDITKFTTPLSELSVDQKNVHLTGTVVDVFGSSTFAKSDQSEGKVLRAKIADDSGEVVVVFWNEKAQELELCIKKDAKLVLVNARPKPSQDGGVEVHVDSSTWVSIMAVQKPPQTIVSLTEGEDDICVEGEVSTPPACKEVTTSKGETVKLCTFDLRDETGEITVTAWRQHAETADNLAAGDKIRIDNVYVKKSYMGEKLELSTRSATTILLLS